MPEGQPQQRPAEELVAVRKRQQVLTMGKERTRHFQKRGQLPNSRAFNPPPTFFVGGGLEA